MGQPAASAARIQTGWKLERRTMSPVLTNGNDTAASTPIGHLHSELGLRSDQRILFSDASAADCVDLTYAGHSEHAEIGSSDIGPWILEGEFVFIGARDADGTSSTRAFEDALVLRWLASDGLPPNYQVTSNGRNFSLDVTSVRSAFPVEGATERTFSVRPAAASGSSQDSRAALDATTVERILNDELGHNTFAASESVIRCEPGGAQKAAGMLIVDHDLPGSVYVYSTAPAAAQALASWVHLFETITSSGPQTCATDGGGHRYHEPVAMRHVDANTLEFHVGATLLPEEREIDFSGVYTVCRNLVLAAGEQQLLSEYRTLFDC